MFTAFTERTEQVRYVLFSTLCLELMKKHSYRIMNIQAFHLVGLRSSKTTEEMKAFLSSFSALSGSTPAEKAENYLLSIGVTSDEISTIRGIFFGEIPVN